jgi:hypothetical protein
MAIAIHIFKRSYLSDEKISRSTENHNHMAAKLSAFQNWFLENGGYMSPHLSLLAPPSAVQYGNGLQVISGEIRQGDKILAIPRDMILTASLTSIPDDEDLNEILVEKQDIELAWILMTECEKGSSSRWFPYMEILPSDIPRLSTFSDKERAWLQDDNGMAHWGAQQREELHRIYMKLIMPLLKDKVNIAATQSKNEREESCWTEFAFCRFVAISSSRAMILQGKKYLTPMADMINHAPRPPQKGGEDQQKDRHFQDISVGSSLPFETFHRWNEGGDLLEVYADRNMSVGDVVLEEYGALDNSLYITSFGFVPRDNPFHCVMLLLPDNYPGLDHDESPEVCVHRDGTILDWEWGKHHSLPKDYVSKHIWIREEAKRQLSARQTTLNHDETLLIELNEYFSSEKDKQNNEEVWEGNRFDQLKAALTFRIEEKKVLTFLANN